MDGTLLRGVHHVTLLHYTSVFRFNKYIYNIWVFNKEHLQLIKTSIN